MSLAVERLVCLLAVLFFLDFADAAVVTAKVPDAGALSETVGVEVGADAKQMMRSHPSPAPKAASKVAITLYYETRCPDCVMFINQTLAPLWGNKDLRLHLNLSIVPYGNAMSIPTANISEGYKFWHPDTTTEGFEYVHVCQHGSDECLGNLIQACAMNNTSQDKFLELVFCMSAFPEYSVEKASYECMTKAGIDHDAVKTCTKSPEGNRLMASLGEQTAKVEGRLGTPWVLVNGANLQNVSNLMGDACTHLNFVPHSCQPFKSQTKAHPAAHPDSHHSGDGDDFRVFEKDLIKISPKHV